MSFRTAPLGTDGEVQQQCSNHRKRKKKKKTIGSTTMASSYTWQAGEVFEADCTAKFSCKKKPVLHIRKKKKKEKKKLRARRWNYYIKPRHQCALTRIPACLWAEKLNLTEEFNILEKSSLICIFTTKLEGMIGWETFGGVSINISISYSEVTAFCVLVWGSDPSLPFFELTVCRTVMKLMQQISH